MRRYVLQEGIPEGVHGWQKAVRVFLDDHLHAGCTELQTVEADDWRSARVQFPDFGMLCGS